MSMGVDPAGEDTAIVSFALTGEMKQYADDIKMFVGLMLEKLQKNVHKGRWENMSTGHAFLLMLDEMDELNDALPKGVTDDIVREAADTANFAMIIASIAQRSK